MSASDRAVELTVAAARAAADLKAQEIIALDVSGQLVLTDAFVIASGTNERQVGAIVDAVEESLHELGAKPLARLLSWGVAAVEPDIMGIGPAPASRKALKKAGLKLEDMDLIEVNEAFAPQAAAVFKELNLDPARTNVDGGAIALTHPLAASGARITVHLIHELRRRGARYGLGSACIGGGQGMAVVIEAL